MSDLLELLKELLLGNGSLKDIGIRFLLFLVGTLFTALMYFLKRELNLILNSSKVLKQDIASTNSNFRKMEESLSEYKKDIAEIMLRHTEILRSESHQLRVKLVELDERLIETTAHLKDSHETREDIYGMMKQVAEIENVKKQAFGRIIVLEKFNNRYEPILAGIEKVMLARKVRNRKKE